MTNRLRQSSRRSLSWAALGLATAIVLCGFTLAGMLAVTTGDLPPKASLSVAGTRWIFDRNGVATCVTLEYRAQPLRAAPALNHQTLSLTWPPFSSDGERLAQIDIATLIGHVALRQHTVCWS